MVEGCHDKKIKLDRKKELQENFNFCFLLSTSASHSYDIKHYYLDNIINKNKNIFIKLIILEYLSNPHNIIIND